MHSVPRLLLVSAALWVGSAPALSAQAPRPAAEDWRVKLGGGVMLAPDYEGSDDYAFQAIPDIEINYRDSLILKNNSLSYNALRAVDPASPWRAGPRLRYGFGRDQDDNAALRGLGDVDPSLELGAFVGYGAGPWSSELSLLQDVGGGHDGLVAQLNSGYSFRFTPRLSARLGASLTYADDDYTQSFFGVTPAQALRSGYAAADAGAGLKDVGVSLGLTYGLTESWTLGGFLGYTRLLGDAADSQIVDGQGSAKQIRTGLTLNYGF